MKTLAAIRHLQGLLAKRFGKGYAPCGESTVYISARVVDMTDRAGTIVAHGPARVVRVLRRKRRK